MRTRQIENINEALLVLRHFIDLSAELLPMLYVLRQKPNPTQEEINNIKKIQDVYEQYAFDTDTSRLLIDSDILDLIQSSFYKMTYKNPHPPLVARKNLYAFLNEYKRLKHNWELTVAN
ncbi:MAG: hypothetical protein ACO2Z9_03770 [Crocinitomicaceae bacterium]